MTKVQTSTRLLALVAAAVIAVAACSAAATPAPTAAPTAAPTEALTAAPTAAPETPAPTQAGPADGGWPWIGTLADGSTFTLAPSIAEKVKAGQPINYVYSDATLTTDIFSAQEAAGYDKSLPDAQKIYPLNAKHVGPTTAYDANAQIAQIEALFNSNQVDCLSIMVNGADTFTNVTKKLQAAGVPVFTVGAPTHGNELQQFTQIPEKEGAQTAEILLQWAKDNNVDLKNFTMSSGNPAASWAQGRFKSFRERILQEIPDAKFVNDETTAINVSFDPAKAYDAYKAFIIGHPDVQIILNADQTAGSAAKAIKDTGNEGKMWSIGWNPSFDQLDEIDAGRQVAVMDQKWADQAGFGALACATLFAKGEILPNTQVLVPVTKATTAESRAWLTELLGAPQ
jgi:ribose transport system substrate-binding protein